MLSNYLSKLYKKESESIEEKCKPNHKKVSEMVEEMMEAMSPEQAKSSISNLKKGLSTCSSKFKGNPKKIKNCQDRLNTIIKNMRDKYNL